MAGNLPVDARDDKSEQPRSHKLTLNMTVWSGPLLSPITQRQQFDADRKSADRSGFASQPASIMPALAVYRTAHILYSVSPATQRPDRP
ncbi:hypothetical protein ACWGM0_18595 (plasmid) [Sphingomonas bisphenolicum]